jgi:hypothetical protein
MDRDTDQKSTLYVAPYIDYYYVSDLDRFGGQTDRHLDTVALTREGGTDRRRLSARAQGAPPFVGSTGDLLTVSTALWRDGYKVDDQSTAQRENRLLGSAAGCSGKPARNGGCR